MKFSYITFMVRDIEKSIAFYQELAGLHIIKRLNPGMGKIAFLANAEGETMVELIQFDTAGKVDVKGMFLSFAAEESLTGLHEKAVRLGYSPSEIISGDLKPAHFTVADPDGITIEFSV